jgi:endonuclease IV
MTDETDRLQRYRKALSDIIINSPDEYAVERAAAALETLDEIQTTLRLITSLEKAASTLDTTIAHTTGDEAKMLCEKYKAVLQKLDEMKLRYQKQMAERN